MRYLATGDPSSIHTTAKPILVAIKNHYATRRDQPCCHSRGSRWTTNVQCRFKRCSKSHRGAFENQSQQLNLLQTLYSFKINPLKNIPGPWWSRFTRLPLRLQIIQGRRIYYIDELHAKYGPYVRIAPNEIAVSDVEAISHIHRIGFDYMKTDWYHT